MASMATQGPSATDATQARKRGGSIQSVARALTILELFSLQRPALTAVEVGELTGLNRATAYRFCQTLLALGYLEDIGNRRFTPGLRTISLAQTALAIRSLPEVATPRLAKLQQETGEAVNMAVLDDTEVVYLVRLLANHLITLRLAVGSRLPAYATSLGRAILAFLPEDEAKDILRRTSLVALTPHTKVTTKELLAELKTIRAQGYALNNQELSVGLRGIAAPVLDGNGRPIAAINISLPHSLGADVERELVSKVQATAGAIGELAAGLGR